ncbi:MAG: oligosaccharide flippase family protein [Lachnospiraceae bacterium]|nr:oligosaccharide flippase family protein [Candidatus Merdinaster equi]
MMETETNSTKRKRSFIVNLLILSVGTILPKFTALITIPIITGALTKEQYGVYDLIVTVVTFLLPIVTMQLHSAAFRFLIECRDDREEENKVISNTFLFAFATTIISAVILFFVLFKYDLIIRGLICAFYVIEVLFRCVQYIARGLNQNKVYSASCVIESVINMLLIIGFLTFMEAGLPGLLGAMIIGQLLAVLYASVRIGLFSRLRISYMSWKRLKEMMAYSIPMIPNVLSIWILSSSDRIVLTSVWGVSVNAVYGVANRIPQVLSTVQTAFTQAWQENASISIKDDNLEKYYSDMFDDVVTILAGFIAALFMALPWLFKLLIHGDYLEAYPHIGILFLGTFFSCIMSFLGGIYVAHKETKSIGITTMISAAINLLIDIAFVCFWRIYAASISTLVAYLVIAVYRMIDVRRFQKINYDIKKLVAIVMILGGMCALSCINTTITIIGNIVVGVAFIAVFERKMFVKIAHMLKGKK